jgi:hypothetical protein
MNTSSLYTGGGVQVALSFINECIDFTDHEFHVFLCDTLTEQIINDSTQAFHDDGSLNNRLSAIYFSLKGFVENWGIPNGMDSYKDFIELNMQKESFIWVAGNSRIMSGYGSVLYEMGILGLSIPILFIISIVNYFKKNRRMQIVISISFTMMMFTPVPIALPYVSFLYGYIIYYSEKRDRNISKPNIIQP